VAHAGAQSSYPGSCASMAQRSLAGAWNVVEVRALLSRTLARIYKGSTKKGKRLSLSCSRIPKLKPKLSAGTRGLLKNSKNGIARELKLARNNENKELMTAHLKVRPLKASQNRVFQQTARGTGERGQCPPHRDARRVHAQETQSTIHGKQGRLFVALSTCSFGRDGRGK
jgi:hypothetical protein